MSIQISWLGFLIVAAVLGLVLFIRVKTLNIYKGVTGDDYNKGRTKR